MFQFFKKKKEPENLKEILSRFKDLEANLANITKEIENLKKENKLNIQKIGVVRFNPFKEMGGNQSFSICLLNGHDDGIVMTSLYTKEGNRVYGKSIKAGISDYLLSEEEKQSIEYAKRGKSKLNNSATGSGGVGPR